MASAKARKGRPSGTGQRKKSPLWLRDLLNILGGLFAGAALVWVVQGYLETQEARGAAKRFFEDVEQAQRALKPFAERAVAVLDGSQAALEALNGLDAGGPVHSLDMFRNFMGDLPLLRDRGFVELLRFYGGLDRAELYRKLLVEHRERPDQVPAVLAREFLRALQESSEGGQRLLRELGPRGKNR